MVYGLVFLSCGMLKGDGTIAAAGLVFPFVLLATDKDKQSTTGTASAKKERTLSTSSQEGG